MITRIEAYGYRCFAHLAVDLGRYQVLAGANGSGKTTLLDIPVLFGDLLRAQRVSDAFLRPTMTRNVPRARTVDELRHCGRERAIMFAIEARLPVDIADELTGLSTASSRKPPPTHLRYEVRFEVYNYELLVSEEYLFLFNEEAQPPAKGVPLQGQDAGGRKSPGSRWRPVISRRLESDTEFTAETTTRGARLPDLRIEREQLALASVPADPTLFPAARWLIAMLRDGALCYEPDWSALREAAPPIDPAKLLPSGRNTPWLALALRRDDPERFDRWVDHVRTGLPQVNSVEVHEREDDHNAYFRVEYAGGYRVTSTGLSDGTLRILAFSLLPYLPESALPNVLIAEEPETGIHPQAIETVVDSLHSLYNRQVWLSTQSPVVLAETELSDVLAARLDDSGAAHVIPGDEHPRLRDWQGGIDLGSLFASGVLS